MRQGASGKGFLMHNYHPEIAALAAFIVSIMVHIAAHYGIETTPDEYAGLVGCTMYIIQRGARKFLNEDNDAVVSEKDGSAK